MEKAIQVSLLLSVFIYVICHFAVFTVLCRKDVPRFIQGVSTIAGLEDEC